MIARRELERRAGALGIGTRHVELDYVLQHLLVQIAREPGDLVFRGGTALARIYWPDFRISEDLDFIGAGTLAGLERQLHRAVILAADGTGLDLQLDPGRWNDDRARALVRWTTPWRTAGELVVDVVRHERPALPPRTGTLDLRYRDFVANGHALPVVDLTEILANKWFMLEAREEPRDLFDLWWALTRGTVGFEDVAHAHQKVYRYDPMEMNIDRAGRLKDRWEQRLAHQIRDLVDFDEAIGAVRERFEAWRSSGKGP